MYTLQMGRAIHGPENIPNLKNQPKDSYKRKQCTFFWQPHSKGLKTEQAGKDILQQDKKMRAIIILLGFITILKGKHTVSTAMVCKQSLLFFVIQQ